MSESLTEREIRGSQNIEEIRTACLSLLAENARFKHANSQLKAEIDSLKSREAKASPIKGPNGVQQLRIEIRQKEEEIRAEVKQLRRKFSSDELQEYTAKLEEKSGEMISFVEQLCAVDADREREMQQNAEMIRQLMARQLGGVSMEPLGGAAPRSPKRPLSPSRRRNSSVKDELSLAHSLLKSQCKSPTHSLPEAKSVTVMPEVVSGTSFDDESKSAEMEEIAALKREIGLLHCRCKELKEECEGVKNENVMLNEKMKEVSSQHRLLEEQQRRAMQAIAEFASGREIEDIKDLQSFFEDECELIRNLAMMLHQMKQQRGGQRAVASDDDEKSEIEIDENSMSLIEEFGKYEADNVGEKEALQDKDTEWGIDGSMQSSSASTHYIQNVDLSVSDYLSFAAHRQFEYSGEEISEDNDRMKRIIETMHQHSGSIDRAVVMLAQYLGEKEQLEKKLDEMENEKNITEQLRQEMMSRIAIGGDIECHISDNGESLLLSIISEVVLDLVPDLTRREEISELIQRLTGLTVEARDLAEPFETDGVLENVQSCFDRTIKLLKSLEERSCELRDLQEAMSLMEQDISRPEVVVREALDSSESRIRELKESIEALSAANDMKRNELSALTEWSVI